MPAAFAPNIPPIPRAPRSELLGKFVPTSIRRLPPVTKMLRPLQVAFYGFFSAGIMPLLQLRTRLNEYTSLEQQQLELAAELVACHVDADDAQVVTAAAKNATSSRALRAFGDATMLGAIVSIVIFMQQHGWTLDAVRRLYFYPPNFADPFATAWLGLLSASYLLAIARVNRHVVRLQQFALAFNAAAEGRCDPIPLPRLVWGARPLHVIVAIPLMMLWAVWALPMLLAWGAYHSFAFRSDAIFRADLSDRLTRLSGVPPVVSRAGVCTNPACGKPLSWEAKFCPRCGRAVQPS